MLDLLVFNTTPPDGRRGMTVVAQNGCMVEVAPVCGAHADRDWLQTRDPVEATRLRAIRLAAYRAIRRIAGFPPATAAPDLPRRPQHLSFFHGAQA